jgi:hypothetical protein
MKKKIAIAAVIAGIGLAGLSQAYAWGPRGGGNYGNCPQYQGSQYSQVDPAVQEKMDKFFTDTQELRKGIAMKRAEKQAMLRGDNPDPAAMSKITGELFDLQATMRAKADEAGVSEFRGQRGGPGSGPGMRGGGPGKGGRYMNGNMDYRGYQGGRS